jgi:hypothetical protein
MEGILPESRIPWNVCRPCACVFVWYTQWELANRQRSQGIPLHSDQFIAYPLDVAVTVVVTVAKCQQDGLGNTPRTVDEFLGTPDHQGRVRTATALRLFAIGVSSPIFKSRSMRPPLMRRETDFISQMSIT